MSRASFSKTSLTQNTIEASDFPQVTKAETIAAGQNLQRGAVLGRITASGKYVLALSAAEDGSNTPRAILAEDVDASAADAAGTQTYRTGHFKPEHLTFGTGITANSARDGLRALGIHI